MGKDYYKLLGVDKGAGDAELKKGEFMSACTPHTHRVSADWCPRLLCLHHRCLLLQCSPLPTAYRKLAMQWHPVRDELGSAESDTCTTITCWIMHACMHCAWPDSVDQSAPHVLAEVAACGVAQYCGGVCRTRTQTTGQQQRPSSKTYQRHTRSAGAAASETGGSMCSHMQRSWRTFLPMHACMAEVLQLGFTLPHMSFSKTAALSLAASSRVWAVSNT